MRSVILATIFILLSISPSFASETEKANDVVVNVNGMVCDFCAQGLKKLFGEREEVKDIAIDLEAGTVALDFAENKTLKDEEIEKIIKDNGISVVSIKRH